MMGIDKKRAIRGAWRISEASLFIAALIGGSIGSILGMKNGLASIAERWIAPINGQLKTAIFGMEQLSVESLIEKTMEHISL